MDWYLRKFLLETHVLVLVLLLVLVLETSFVS
jgi:hypothetical protein